MMDSIHSNPQGSHRGGSRSDKSTKEAGTDCRLEGEEDKTIPLSGSSITRMAATTANPTASSSASSTAVPDPIPTAFLPFDGRTDFRSLLQRFRFHTNEMMDSIHSNPQGSHRGGSRSDKSTKEAGTDCRLEGEEDKTIPLSGSSITRVAATTANPTASSSSSSTAVPDPIPTAFLPFDGRTDFRSLLRRFRFHTNEFNCHLDIRERVLRFGSEPTPLRHANLMPQQDEICAAIAAAVALPPTNLGSILPADAELSEEDRMDLKSLLATFEDVFAWDERSLGRSTLVRHAIDTGSAKPVWQPPRRISPHFQTEVNEMIQMMLDSCLIRLSRSHWASPVTLVPKKDGKLRFCIDYRRLNAVTIRVSFPLPRIDVTLDALAGARWFSTLDLKLGYWQVEVESKDRPKTAFILPQDIARPLHRLTEMGRTFKWTEECQAAFDELKTRLTTAPILMLPNTQLDAPPFILDTDASGFAIGGVLSQCDETGAERPVCFASKTLTKPQRNYCIYRRELLALITFVKQFKPFLIGRHFIIRSDHKALQWLQKIKDAEGQLARWQEVLQQFDFSFHFRPEKKHANADAMSRRPADTGDKLPTEDSHFITALTISEPTRHHWAIAQSTDPDTAIVYDHQLNGRHRPTDSELRGSSDSARIIRSHWAHLLMENDLLFFKDDTHNQPRLVVPGSLVPPILDDLHRELGHVGHVKTEAAVRQRFWWPRLRVQVLIFCNTCPTRATFKGLNPRRQAPLQPMATGFPFERVGIDVIGPLPITLTVNRYILVMVDYFIQWAEAVTLPRQDAASFTTALLTTWVCRFGAPISLHSDCGANFESRVVRDVCDLLQIHKTHTTSAHPEGNGQVERTNRTIINLLKAFAEDHHPHNWDVRLPYAMMAYRCAVHTSTGYAPFFMLTGRHFRLLSDSQLPLPIGDDYQPDAYVLELQETLRTTHNLPRPHLESSYTRQKAYFDQHVSGTPYDPGDLVLRYRPTPPVGTSSKFFHPWEGPFVVLDFFPPSTYTIRDAQSTGGPDLTVHYDKLKPYRGRLPNATADTLPILPPHLVPQPSDEVEITSSPFQAVPLRTEPPLERRRV
nr:unnamed protein product [Spirometra erinaceieuropaei]